MALPLVFEDGFACGPDLMRIVDENPLLAMHDRRRRPRVALCWTVYLLRDSSDRPIESRTKNISSEGFYCYVAEPLNAGDVICSIIHVPAADPARSERTIALHCRCRVLRVEAVSAVMFGVACRIEDYIVVGGTV